MPTLAFFKFNSFVEAEAEKKHDLGADVIKLYLTNVQPNASSHAVKADLAEIATGFGYSGPITLTRVSSAQAAGLYKVVFNSPGNITASGGSIGPFRAVVAYNDTAANDELIGAWDNGSSITLTDGQYLALTLDAVNGLLTKQ